MNQKGFGVFHVIEWLEDGQTASKKKPMDGASEQTFGFPSSPIHTRINLFMVAKENKTCGECGLWSGRCRAHHVNRIAASPSCEDFKEKR